MSAVARPGTRPRKTCSWKTPCPFSCVRGLSPHIFISVRPSGGGAVRPGSRHGSALGESFATRCGRCLDAAVPPLALRAPVCSASHQWCRGLATPSPRGPRGFQPLGQPWVGRRWRLSAWEPRHGRVRPCGPSRGPSWPRVWRACPPCPMGPWWLCPFPLRRTPRGPSWAAARGRWPLRRSASARPAPLHGWPRPSQ